MAFSKQLEKDSLKITVSSDGKLIKVYSREYHCKNETELTLDQVGDEVGILPGAPHPDWEAARANDISIDRNMTREPYCSWKAKYNYSTEGVVPADSGSTAPEDRRVNRSIGTTQQQRFITSDKNGVLITDAAGSPYDGGVPVTDYMGTFQWERDEPHTGFNMAQSQALSGKLNSATYMGHPPRTLLLEVVSREKWEGGYHFWTTTYTMTYNKGGWQPRPLNAGLYQRVAGKRVRITEEDSEGKRVPTQEPQPLWPSTNISPPAGSVIALASRPAACNFLDIEHHDEFDFADLGLPTT